MQLLLRNIKRATVAYVFFHLIFKLQLFNQCTAGNGNDKTKHHIDGGNLPPENTHKQYKASEVDHRRGDQE